MKYGYKLTLAVLIAAACLAWSAWTIYQKRDAATQKNLRLAAMVRLNETIRSALSDYYQANTRYPKTLDDLRIDPAAAGATADMLAGFSYKSDDKYYLISWSLQWADEPAQTHHEQAVKRKVMYVEEYIDEVLRTRTEYPEGLIKPDTRTEKQYRDGVPFSTTVYKNGQPVSQ